MRIYIYIGLYAFDSSSSTSSSKLHLSRADRRTIAVLVFNYLILTKNNMIWWCYRVVVYNKVNPTHVGEDLENVQDCSFHIWSPVGLSESKTVLCPVIF